MEVQEPDLSKLPLVMGLASKGWAGPYKYIMWSKEEERYACLSENGIVYFQNIKPYIAPYKRRMTAEFVELIEIGKKEAKRARLRLLSTETITEEV